MAIEQIILNIIFAATAGWTAYQERKLRMLDAALKECQEGKEQIKKDLEECRRNSNIAVRAAQPRRN